MDKEIMCVLCPNSCHIQVEYEANKNKLDSIKGNKCSRGEDFALQEITSPQRTLTYSVLVKNGDMPLLSTKSARQIPLYKIVDIVKKLKHLVVKAPINCGDVVYSDGICTIIATRNICLK